ncbi:MAG: hypothetical protein ACI30R_01945 [Sodaliphilus sp.]
MPKAVAKYPLLLLAIAFALAACDSSDDLATEERRYDMVTYMGYHDGVAEWQFIRPGDEGIDNMMATMDEPVNLQPGQRVLLSYSVADALPRIQVWGYTYGNVVSDSLRVNVKPVEDYAKHPIKLGALWRTGNYINLRCEVEYTKQVRALFMMADRATLDHDTIDVHLIHDLISAQETYFWRTCYGSFYAGAAFSRSRCKAIRVHVNDLTYPEVKTYVFARPQQ